MFHGPAASCLLNSQIRSPPLKPIPTSTHLGNYAGEYLTATATSAGGNTSEFSPDVLATNAPVTSAFLTGNLVSNANGFSFSAILQTNFSYRIQSATNLAALIAWTDLTNFTPTNSRFNFTDWTATDSKARFYRVISP